MIEKERELPKGRVSSGIGALDRDGVLAGREAGVAAEVGAINYRRRAVDIDGDRRGIVDMSGDRNRRTRMDRSVIGRRDHREGRLGIEDLRFELQMRSGRRNPLHE